MSELQRKIKKTLEEARQLEKVRNHLTRLNERLAKSYEQQDQLVKMLEKEYADVSQLEKLSLKSLFHKVLGSKEEQLSQERQQYLQASLKYDEHKKTVDLLEFERKVLEEKLIGKGNLEASLEKLLQKRERELIRENDKQGRELLRIQKEIEQQQAIIMEVKEAIHVGQDALNVLEKMLGFLRSARNWGKWSRGHRGNISAQFKHSNIDRAREQAYLAQQLLHRFEEELRDIYNNVEKLQVQVELDSFSRFMDVFFDNLISDWIIQQKIQNALSNVSAVRDRLLRLLEGLRNEEINSLSKIKTLQRRRRKVLSN